MVTKAEIKTIKNVIYNYLELLDVSISYEANEAREAIEILDSIKPVTKQDVLDTLETYEEGENQ